jgi:hypothetical protein
VAGGLWVPGDELDRWFRHDELGPICETTIDLTRRSRARK